MNTPHKIAEVRDLLEDRTDGPVTQFVLIARACDLSASGDYDSDTIANALHEGLQASRGTLASLERC